jgi:F-type H+-transporting ATPase subunit delta
MSDETSRGYAGALFEVARAEGVLDRVADEVYRFSRTVDGNGDLRSALTDPSSSADAKARVVGELLESKASPVTTRLVAFLVEAGQARNLAAIADALAQRAASEREAAVAEVRVAAPISEDQRQRIAEALTQAKGRPVDVKVFVDPSVLGGVITTIGDEVIDGSVRRRLEQLRAELSAN